MITTVTLNPSLDEWVRLVELRIGRLNRAVAFARYPGGKGINVSRIIHELGGSTLALAISGGQDGVILSHRLRELGIRHAFAHVPGTTRNNYKILAGNVLTEINTPGPRVSGASLNELRRRLMAAPRPRAAVLSGSLPPGAPPWIYARWIRALRRAAVPAALDSSGAPMRLGVAARPWLIKPNRDEAEELVGYRVAGVPAAANAVRELLRRGPEVVVLSLGPAGAVLGARGLPRLWLAEPPAVRTHSAVGAGDSLVGGFVTASMRGAPLTEALRWGIACGTATAVAPGTELGRRADVQRLLSRVRIRELKEAS